MQAQRRQAFPSLRKTKWSMRSNRSSVSAGALELGGGGGGTTRPLPRDGGVEELRGDPTVGPHPKVWTIDRE